jgi:hypothetical protein
VKRGHVRPDDDLREADEVLIRGGLFDPEILRADAQRMFDVYGTYGISVFALRGTSVDESAQQPPLVRFAHLTLVTLGDLRHVGMALEPTGRNPRHYTIVLGDLDVGIAALLRSRRQALTNPYHEG